jgi:hypothetical protein
MTHNELVNQFGNFIGKLYPLAQMSAYLDGYPGQLPDWRLFPNSSVDKV